MRLPDSRTKAACEGGARIARAGLAVGVGLLGAGLLGGGLLGGGLLGGGASAAIEPAPASEAGRLILVRTERIIAATGDPVWQLRLTRPGQLPRSFEALVGRAGRQQADRNRLGSQAPLPLGHYIVTEITAVGPEDPPELGGPVWIGLQPQFPTARRALGIHQDPSAGLGADSGTDGCIGLIRGDDLLALAELLQRTGIRELVVSQ